MGTRIRLWYQVEVSVCLRFDGSFHLYGESTFFKLVCPMPNAHFSRVQRVVIDVIDKAFRSHFPIVQPPHHRETTRPMKLYPAIE